MASTSRPVAELNLTELRTSVDTVLAEFLAERSRTATHPQLRLLVDIVREFLAAGGKRLRPVLCLVGWHAAGGSGELDRVVRVAAGLELFHAAALIHDDIIDDSTLRRGRPAVHTVLAGHCPANTEGRAFGANAAILLGDLVLVWSDELVHAAAPGDAVLALVDAMRAEVMLGQHLDLCTAGRPTGDLDAALTIVRHKTARYTVERPLRIGATLAGADPDLLAACSAFGLPLGEAFQLRDDLLGVFGDPARTGKPVLDDLREGKHTALVALALRQANHRQRTRLRHLLGDPALTEAGAREARDLLAGAREAVEGMIVDRYRRALAVLADAPFRPAASEALRALADAVVRRTA